MEGRLGRFYEDNCLLDQKFVLEEKLSVQARPAMHAKLMRQNTHRAMCTLTADLLPMRSLSTRQ